MRDGDAHVIARPDRIARTPRDWTPGIVHRSHCCERTRKAEPGKYARAGKQKVLAGAIQALANDGFGPTRIARIMRISRDTVRRYLPSDYRAPRQPKRVPRERIDARTVQVAPFGRCGPPESSS
jgi:hypothetical protein